MCGEGRVRCERFGHKEMVQAKHIFAHLRTPRRNLCGSTADEARSGAVHEAF